MKKNSGFFCSECGFEAAKWTGQCPSCHAWNTMVEEPSAPKIQRGRAAGGNDRFGRGVRLPAKPVELSAISADCEERFGTGFSELDRVLGGGTVAGSLVLVGGDPGIGKSTILLQVCRNYAAQGRKVLYISGEESLKQIRLRAARIGEISGDLRFLSETDLDLIRAVIEEERPQAAVIDSIQTMYCEEVAAAPGSVSQVRESTNVLMQLAKGSGTTIFIIGHVTKEGQVAGPRVLEHMVDTVLYFEGEKHVSYRILRAVKNRFGSTNEIGVFEMTEAGLKEVPNPSEYMLEGRPVGASGAVVACSVEGSRPMLLEVQALVSETAFGMPRRTAAGIDFNRVNLLMAVLEKRCRLPMSRLDAYVNVAGGMRMNEPAMDLAVVMAIVSSYRDIPIEEHTVLFGEVGLSGEVRSVSLAEYRVREAAKLGFRRCVLPQSCLSRLKIPQGIDCVGVASVREAMELLFY